MNQTDANNNGSSAGDWVNPPLGKVGHVYHGTGSGKYYIFIGIFLGVWLLGVILFTLFRNYQPLRARDYTITMLSTCLPVSALVAFCMRGELGDTLSTCWSSWLFANLLGPFWIVPFELSALGLIYVYEWNLEKLTRTKGFWRRHAIIFFSPTFRIAVIFCFVVAQVGLSAIVQHAQFYAGPTECVLASTYSAAPFYIIYVLVYIVILWKLYHVEDVFHMKLQFLMLFVSTASFVLAWIIVSTMQNNQHVSSLFFGPILICVAIALPTISLLYHPLVLLLFEPWRSLMSADRNAHSAGSGSDNGLSSARLRRVMSRNGSENHHSANENTGSEGGEEQIPAPRQPKSRMAYNLETDENIPLKAYLTDTMYAESFKRHCVKNFCAESVMFYLDAHDAINQAATRTSAELEEIVRNVMQLYIYPESDLEVNITYHLRENIIKEYQYVKNDPNIFKTAITDVYWMLKSNVFKTWLESRDFKRVRLMKTDPAYLAAQRRSTATRPLIPEPTHTMATSSSSVAIEMSEQ